jgi:cytochrome P450
MTQEREPEPVDLGEWERCGQHFKRNRLLFDWLCDDARRADLYAALRGRKSLRFESRAPLPPALPGLDPASAPEHRSAHLVLDRELIASILADTSGAYSNAPYADIGTGSFMLALDSQRAEHAQQRCLLGQALAKVPHHEQADLCRLAIEQALLVALGSDAFDAAALAEQAAIRWCLMLFGFAPRDQRQLEAACKAGYNALIYTNLARHFVTDPTVLPQAEREMGLLARRAAELIDEYALRRDDDHWPDDGMAPPGKHAFKPVMYWLPRLLGQQRLSGEQLAVVVVGSIVGTVGNVQAATCIALEALLRRDPAQGKPSAADAQATCKLIGEALAAHPPVPFLPRRVTKDVDGFDAGDELVLAMGAALHGTKDDCPPDPLIFGAGSHRCVGESIGRLMVFELVDRVLALPALARRIDSVDGRPMPLKKRWAFHCHSLPLVHRRQSRLLQQPLNVAMRVKAPISDSAARLRETIRIAAPRIEQALRESNHVHFAWFEFFDNDATLVLHTVYDGDFAAYIEHFALNVGDLFDELFQYIEPAPPMPVKEHPFEFVELIRRFNRPPVGGYFFSAYPGLGAAECTRHQRSWTNRI